MLPMTIDQLQIHNAHLASLYPHAGTTIFALSWWLRSLKTHSISLLSDCLGTL